MIRKILIGAVAAVAFTASPANASVFKYVLSNNSTLTIDTVAQRGSLIGENINATFSGKDLASFAGEDNLPNFMGNIVIDSSSTRTTSTGNVYSVINGGHPQMLTTGTISYKGAPTVGVNLWGLWKSSSCSKCQLEDYKAPLYATSSSSGGTAVPEPGMIGLFGLGVVGLVLGRRRSLRQAPALA